MAAQPVVVISQIFDKIIELEFRQITIADRLYNSKRFGGDEALAEAVAKVNVDVVSKILFRQLTLRSKCDLKEFSNLFEDIDEEGNTINDNLNEFQVFLRLPIFAPQSLVKIIVAVSGIDTDDEESGDKKKEGKNQARSSTGPLQSSESPNRQAGQSKKSSDSPPPSSL